MFNKVIIGFVLTVFLHAQVTLGCEKPVTGVTKGDKAPCTGFLFSPDKEQEVRIKVREHEVQKTEIMLQKKKINLLLDNEEYWQQIADKEAEKAELWRNRAEDSTKKLVSSERYRGARDWMFLVSGVLLTVGAGVAVGQANK